MSFNYLTSFLGIVILLLATICTSCIERNSSGVNVAQTPHKLLSQYQFFTGNIADLNPSQGVVPYDLSSPLFSDYAHKLRFVWMPEGSSARYTEEHVLDFPEGTVLIKNFFYNNDERDHSLGRKIIETRLLINKGEEWDAYGYIWKDDQSDAVYETIGDIQEMAWIAESGETVTTNYIIPNKNQCKGCHAYDNKQMPIGPKARNLNKAFAYADGDKNQLIKWSELGYLNGMPEMDRIAHVAQWNNQAESLDRRAMAYLDINCGHCHNPKGAANTSGLNLTTDVDIGLSLGIFKPTVSAGQGTGGHTYSIVPGNPDESIMIYRMKSTDPGAMMPELGRQLVHQEGVALISEWIARMEL